MANPYRSAGRSGAKLKFRAMLGSDAGAKHVNDDSVVNGSTPVKNGIEDVKILGKKPSARLDRARGGKVSKNGGTTVNVIIPPSQGASPPMPLPPMPPPGAGPGGPPMPPPGMKPPMMPPGGPMAGPPPGLPMKAGGGGISDIKRRDLQERINAADPMSGIAPTGIGPKYVGVGTKKRGGSVMKAKGGSISGLSKSNKQWEGYASKNSYHKKSGGGITKAKLTGGADSGVGRLQHSKAQGKTK